MKIVTVEQMMELEKRSAEVGAPPDFLMENAGLAVANGTRNLLNDVAYRSIVILVGPGNNGGDGLVAARHLHDWGAKVQLFLVKRETENDRNFELDMQRNIPWADALAEEDLSTFHSALKSADIFVDSLFGTGKIRPFKGVLKDLLISVQREKESRPSLKIVAVDLPSGLDADTGAVDPVTLKADWTVTFACPKIGLFRFPGAEHLGQLEIADIQIPEYLAEDIPIEVITDEAVQKMLPPRPLNANKGTFGRLMVVAGSMNYIGAAYLACEAAMRVGTGLVTLATPRSLVGILSSKLTETTYLPLEESDPGVISAEAVPAVKDQFDGYSSVLIGCGLGRNPSTSEFLQKLLAVESTDKQAVIDADGLNILSELDAWWEILPAQTVLTPHPGEMSRLTGRSISEIQEDRIRAALSSAAEWNRVVVLKGAFTVVASPGNEARVCGVANPGLASAGTGDVLAGAIAGLLAQGLAPFDAATCGVYLHAMAGELVKAEIGDSGMVASDLLLALPTVIADIKVDEQK